MKTNNTDMSEGDAEPAEAVQRVASTAHTVAMAGVIIESGAVHAVLARRNHAYAEGYDGV